MSSAEHRNSGSSMPADMRNRIATDFTEELPGHRRSPRPDDCIYNREADSDCVYLKEEPGEEEPAVVVSPRKEAVKRTEESGAGTELSSELLDMLATGFLEEAPRRGELRPDNCNCDIASNPDCVHTDEEAATEKASATASPDESPNSIRPVAKKQRTCPNSTNNNPLMSFAQDIRRDYARMFLQTLNSGDLEQIQSFFRAFMTPSCKFAIQHQINQHYGLPQFLNSTGPNLFAHYLMGCFMMFPDMIIRLTDAKVSVSSSWKGSRIVMETEIQGSKMRSIRNYPWLPAEEALTLLYESAGRGTAPSSSSGVGDSSSGGERAKTVKGEIDIQAGQGKQSAPGAQLTSAFMSAVIEESQVVPKPLNLRTRGSITLYLDQNNCIQYMICSQTSV